MTTKHAIIEVSNLRVEIVRKNIKNLHLGVYPPDGRIRVATPEHVSDDSVRLAVISRLSWIKKQCQQFQQQARHSAREMISGESHWVFGKRYRLEVIEQSGKPNVVIKNNAWLSLYVPPATAPAQREQVLNEWYRQALKARIPALLRKWEQRIGVTSAAWGVRKMKTKWGSCDSAKRRLLFNLELAKKPPECLEYIVVHELLHLLERCHSDRFRGYLDTYLPHWRSRREMLNRAPLNHEIWP